MASTPDPAEERGAAGDGRADGGGSSSGRHALRAAAVAAATTAGAAAARQAFKRARSAGSEAREKGLSGDTISSGAKAAWQAARQHLLPAAEEAAQALGRYLATDAPELVRDVLVPRLVRSFEEARSSAGEPERPEDKTRQASAA